MLEEFRFLDVKVFNSLVRPQYEASCSVTSITSCLRYFTMSPITQEHVAKELGLNIKSRSFDPENTDVADWIEKVGKSTGLTINTQILFEGGWDINDKCNDSNWDFLKQSLQNDNEYLILHVEHHYAPILGFATFPEGAESQEEDGQRWVIVADPSPYHKPSQIESQHLKASPPIWTIRWGVLSRQFKENHYGIIKCMLNKFN